MNRSSRARLRLLTRLLWVLLPSFFLFIVFCQNDTRHNEQKDATQIERKGQAPITDLTPVDPQSVVPTPGALPPFKHPDLFIPHDEYAKYDELDRQGKLRDTLRDTEGLIKLESGQSIADIGCGPGRMLTTFADIVGPDGTVWAVDVDPNAIEFIEYRLERSEEFYGKQYGNINTVVSSFSDIGLPDDSIDWAWLQEVHNYTIVPDNPDILSMPDNASRTEILNKFHDNNRMFTESVHRALRPGGKMVIREMKYNKGATFDINEAIDFIENTHLFRLNVFLDDNRGNYLLLFEKI
jgi:SAM-dependent methyltransferase